MPQIKLQSSNNINLTQETFRLQNYKREVQEKPFFQ